ncbi:hypothetical protein D3C87_1869980 [compost metagenome]
MEPFRDQPSGFRSLEASEAAGPGDLLRREWVGEDIAVDFGDRHPRDRVPQLGQGLAVMAIQDDQGTVV